MCSLWRRMPEAHPGIRWQDRVWGHLELLRLDHGTKNLFVIPGILIPLSFRRDLIAWDLVPRILLGFLAVTLIASSNYVINELMDAPYDRFHSVKSSRPTVRGVIILPAAYAQWLGLMVVGLWIGVQLSVYFTIVLAALWIMGCIYNLPPVRTKDVPYVDVLSESINNPLRLLLGWYMVPTTLIAPASLLLSYWMTGAYFMALKRFSEYREIADAAVAGAYRRSFRFYSERNLLVSVVFYAATSMLFFGAFLIRYRMELVLTFPLIAWVMTVYFLIAFKKNSPVQHPEKLHREPMLVVAVVLCAVGMGLFLWVDVPALQMIFAPTLPVAGR
ncbi:MAG: prenyltransferase [Terriglobia bacterium]|nr:MAG: prenyltransferase [Terriglobia bacterium]